MTLLKLDLKEAGFVDKENYYLCKVMERIFVSKISYSQLDKVNYVPVVDDVKGKVVYSIYDLDELYLIED